MNSTENEITVSCTNNQSEGGNGLSRKKKTGLLQENRLFFGMFEQSFTFLNNYCY